jgi:hypothetical protein
MKRSFFSMFLCYGLLALSEPKDFACAPVPTYAAQYDSTRVATTAVKHGDADGNSYQSNRSRN